jgi:hypothetical protein
MVGRLLNGSAEYYSLANIIAASTVQLDVTGITLRPHEGTWRSMLRMLSRMVAFTSIRKKLAG